MGKRKCSTGQKKERVEKNRGENRESLTIESWEFKAGHKGINRDMWENESEMKRKCDS
jgi:hypothetical protein